MHINLWKPNLNQELHCINQHLFLMKQFLLCPSKHCSSDKRKTVLDFKVLIALEFYKVRHPPTFVRERPDLVSCTSLHVFQENCALVVVVRQTLRPVHAFRKQLHTDLLFSFLLLYVVCILCQLVVIYFCKDKTF